ncbi:MAG: Ig-like domain-containing protein [Candidatus Hatepunaea meridiana]|nr:Ig-like domain-containing protein [Candidatus Hatepunaea meridiana]
MHPKVSAGHLCLIPVLLFVILFSSTGCDDETISNPQEPPNYTLTFNGLPDSLTAPEGVTRQIPFILTIKDERNNPVSDVAVEFSVPIGEGQINPTQVETNASGIIEEDLYVTMTKDVDLLQVSAWYDGGVSSTAIELVAINRPARMLLLADATRLVVPDETNGEITLTAVVTDIDGVCIPGIRLSTEIVPIEEGGEIFGSLNQPDPTDDNGQSEFVFSSYGGFGSQIIRCSVVPEDGGSDETVAELQIDVQSIRQRIARFRFWSSSRFIEIESGNEVIVELFASVTDVDTIGIPDLRINFSAGFGRITRTALTDSSGMVYASYSLRAEDMPDEYTNCVTITAEIPGTEWSEELFIGISRPDIGADLILEVGGDSIFCGFIYADNGISIAKLLAVFKGSNGRGIPGREITFTTTHGLISQSAITNEWGTAEAVFTDSGVPSYDDEGDLIPATIIARYIPWNLSASLAITIRELPPVTRISLIAADEQMSAGSRDSLHIIATCFLANHRLAIPGIVVHFETNNGHFTDEVVVITGVYGKAESCYIPGLRAGEATSRVYVVNADSSICSIEFTTLIIAGPPSCISVTAVPETLSVNNLNDYSTITAIVVDEYDNPVEGVLVTFETTNGTLNDCSVTTNENGEAITQLSPGFGSQATITATVNTREGSISGSTTVYFIAGEPHSIELIAEVREDTMGTGGIVGPSILYATVYDVYGNPVNRQMWIVFDLINEPPVDEGGSSINGRGRCDSVLTNNGMATVEIYRGFRSRICLARAYTYRDEARTEFISATCHIVFTIVSPTRISLSVDERGEDRDGGVWALEVSAIVTDDFGCPAPNRIPVQFTTDSVATIGAAQTGNENRAGLSTPGVAYATMLYNSHNTFDPVTIVAEIRTQQRIITAELEFILPLQEGQISLNIDPRNWNFDGNDDLCNISIEADVRDGHDVLILNAPVLYSSTRAQYFWYNSDRWRYYPFYPEPARWLTGQGPVFLRGEESDFFLDPIRHEVAVLIECHIDGQIDVSTERFIIITRE